MIKLDKEFGLICIGFFGFVWYIGSLRAAFEATTVLMGGMYFTYNIVFVYNKLKDVRFNFRKAATKKEWLWFLGTNIFLWSVFLCFLSETGLTFVTIIPTGMLIILFIYDILKTIISRWWK